MMKKLGWSIYTEEAHGVSSNADERMRKRIDEFDGLVHERRNPSALTMELRLSCINPSSWA